MKTIKLFMQLQRKNKFRICYLPIKRSIDFILAVLLLVINIPSFILIALFVKTDSPGKIFYKGIRVGVNGKIFKMYKFRTMVKNAEKLGGVTTAADDNRITKVGCVLRKYKLDEIPQLINIIKGDMSFVGPRPEVLSEVEKYSLKNRKILTVRPGITDYASLCFHNEGELLKGSSNPHMDYVKKIQPKKLELALKYVKEMSICVDIKILIDTVITLFMTRRKKP